MKIDFTRSYAEIQKLIGQHRRPEAGQAERNTFEKTLSDISPDPSARDKTVTRAAADSSRSAEGANPPPPGPMARYNFEEPNMKSPIIPSMAPGLEAGERVKKPTILEVRRKTDNRSFSELKKDDRIAAVKGILENVGPEQGVDPLLGQAVISAESSFNASAISSDGHESKGLFQLLDDTGKELHASSGLSGAYNPFDPEQNIQLGMRYLRRLHDTFSQPTELVNNAQTVPAANSSSLEKLAVAAFNAGEGRVASAQQQAMRFGSDPTTYEGIASYLPKSTQEYVERVMQLKGQYGVEFIS